MPPIEIISFEEAISDTGEEDRTLLLGNGFSINHFNYGSLLEASEIEEGTPLRDLFTRLDDTKDFELVMRNLEDAALVEDVYGNADQAQVFNDDANTLREGLIHAINETHPTIQTELDDVIPSCVAFISNFKKIFTLNYDLLLYWVQLNTGQFSDGFGLGERSGGFKGPFKEDAFCDIYYLHGGLHLFQTRWDETHKRVVDNGTIVSEVTNTIRTRRKLPLYIAEGTSNKKLAKINSTPYLKHCLDTLEEAAGNLFIYGHSASENDAHIYRAIFKSQVKKVYFCIHEPTADLNAINGELQRYKALYPSARSKEIIFVNSETAHVWDAVLDNEEEEQ